MPVQPSVVWITSGFPYGSGEQFIETEVPHWAEFKGRPGVGWCPVSERPEDALSDHLAAICWGFEPHLQRIYR